MNSRDVIRIYKHLFKYDIKVWLTGGWGIDALLGENTRPHKDLDVLVPFEDIVKLCRIMSVEGYEIIEVWEENCWRVDADGNQIPTAFVLEDAQGCQLDVHAVDLNAQGDALPAWNEADEFMFSAENLASTGLIEGFLVRCISATAQVFCHVGYELPEEHLKDMKLLQDKFGVGGK